ncbi:MAG: MurR/RpiR family transcriptional regulator [Xanthomonadaceae bacterium]|nr:MurR/RpiR family transcriptional regulator [Xanthomonadaceae bacterium]
MPKTVVERLRDGLAEFPATERRVAQRLLADYPMSGLQSATELAREVAVSTPTVLRLVTRLGFGAYAQFQRALRDELAAQLSSPLAKSASPRRGKSASPPLAFADAVLGNVRETFAHLGQGQLEQTARLLADRRLRVHLVGGRFSDALARYLAVQLRILRPGVNHLEDQESNWDDQLLDMGKRDLLLVFDVRRYQPSLLRLAQAASQRGVRVVLFTDQWLSPIARHAAQVFSARIAVPSAWDSGAALLALAEALLANATRLGWEHGSRRMRELEAMRASQAEVEPTPKPRAKPARSR